MEYRGLEICLQICEFTLVQFTFIEILKGGVNWYARHTFVAHYALEKLQETLQCLILAKCKDTS